ncbi:MAG: FAD-dependent oxidoreductase [Verrucomicrobiota bacterium]
MKLAISLLNGLWVLALAGLADANWLSAQTPEYPIETITSYTSFRKPSQPVKMVQDGFLWIEAEDFQNYGDWRLDTQFVQQMGSAYLIAAGVGRPIADAQTPVQITKAGTYRVWVRAKNWIKDHAPGKFTILVGDTRSQKVFGAAPTTDWIWESAGDFPLPAGSTTITLHDLTGYFGRCDALLLTTDLTYTPPADLAKLQLERARLSGISLEPKPEGDFDVVVVGAGAAGCSAAIAAARMGSRTALLQDRPVLGGNASDELGVGMCGASVTHPNARESGIIEEAGRLRAKYHHDRMSESFRMLAEAETNLTIFYNHRVTGVAMSNPGTIAQAKSVNTLDGSQSTVRGRYFIDCTGDGWLGYFAGAQFRLGREAREEFGEDLAPPRADKITMSGCLMGNYAISFHAKPTGGNVPYVPPVWAPKLPPADQFGRRIRHVTTGEWWLEHPGEIDDLWDPELARDELIKISFAYWNFIKNHWEERETARAHVLTYVPFMNAKRETRRLIGDYLLRQQDVLNGTVFPDRISYGGWPIDVHHPKGVFSGKEGPFYCDTRVPIYTIPYRCLYSTNIANLFFAGRDVSVTHIALGTVRVQGTLATLGQAVGVAAALCLQKNATPRALGLKHLDLLQQTLLKHDQYIPELKNEDPLDLARTAKITASSVSAGDSFDKNRITTHDSHELAMPRGIQFPRGVNQSLQTVYVLLRSERTEATPLTLHVRGGKSAGDFTAANDLATATANVPAKKQAWVKFTVNCRVDDPFVWFWLPAAKGIEWVMMTQAPLESSRAYGGGPNRPWSSVKGQYYATYTDPPIITQAGYQTENVINGVSRTVGKQMNQWASDPAQPLPQWLELDFGRATKVNTVYLTFDTDMNERSATTPLPPRCVRDYSVQIQDATGWRDVATAKDNFQRRRIHRFPEVATQRIRILVHATNGDKSARIFEVRAYTE